MIKIKFSYKCAIQTTGIILFFIFIGFLLRIQGDRIISFWGDEMEAWYAALTGFPVQHEAPLIILASKMMMILFHSADVTVYHLFPFIIGLSNIVVAYFLGKMLISKKVGFLLSLAVTLSRMDIHYSQEARSYSLFAFFTMLATLFFYLSFESDQWKYWLWYGLALMGAFLTHALAVSYAMGLVLFVSIRTVKTHEIKIAFKFGLISMLFCLFGSYWIFPKIQRFESLTAHVSFPDLIPFLRGLFTAFSGWGNFYGNTAFNIQDFVAISFGLLFLIGMIKMFKWNSERGYLVLCLFIIPIVFLYATLGNKNWPGWPRYAYHAHILFLLPICFALSNFMRKKTMIQLGVFISLLFFPGISESMKNNARTDVPYIQIAQRIKYHSYDGIVYNPEWDINGGIRDVNMIWYYGGEHDNFLVADKYEFRKLNSQYVKWANQTVPVYSDISDYKLKSGTYLFINYQCKENNHLSQYSTMAHDNYVQWVGDCRIN